MTSDVLDIIIIIMGATTTMMVVSKGSRNTYKSYKFAKKGYEVNYENVLNG